MNEPTHLCLFSGTGIPSLVMQRLGFRTVGYIEADPHCQACIRQRVREGHLDDAPLFPDVRTFDGLPYRGRVDLVSAGFPCQPFSVAGRRKSSDDERNLWPDTIRIVREVRPALALFENVPGLLSTQYFGTILEDLETSGYRLVGTPQVVGAYEVGAPHLRNRVFWVAADSKRDELQDESRGRNGASGEGKTEPCVDGKGGTVAYSTRERGGRLSIQSGGPLEADAHSERSSEALAHAASVSERESTNETDTQPDGRRTRQEFGRRGWWTTEPDVGRVADGVARRVVRLRALGNGWVPQQAIEAIRRIVT